MGDVPGRESWRRPAHFVRNIWRELERSDGKTDSEMEIDVYEMLDLCACGDGRWAPPTGRAAWMSLTRISRSSVGESLLSIASE